MTKLHQSREDTYFRVMSVLEKNPEISQRDLAKNLGISLGGINYALHALIDRGMIKAQNFSKSKRKLSYVYILTPHGLAEKTRITAFFLKRKIREYETLKAEIESLKRSIKSDVQNKHEKTSIC